MAGEEDDVIVNLSGDTSTHDVKVKVEGDKGGNGTNVSFNGEDEADPVADLKNQFNQISGRLQTVVAQQQQTAQQLDAANQRLQRAESQVVVSQIETIENGISQVEQDLASAERAYAAAMEAGDGAAMARATRAMQRGEIQLSELAQARDAMKRDATRRPPAQQPGGPTRPVPADPVEAVIATGNMSAKSAAWLRAHPECVTDPAQNKKMLAAHHRALADDIAVDSDEYFQRIEAGIKGVKKEDPKPADPKPSGDGRRPSSGAASGSGAGGGLNGGSIEVKLTKREADSATDGTLVWNYDDPSGKGRFKKGDPIGLAEMARRKHEGMKQGLYDKNNFEA
jgi:hypothetical protein